MGVPKKHTTHSQVRQRRGQHKLVASIFTKCSKCGKPVLSHTFCRNCGYYKGQEVVNVLAKLEKKERKHRELEIKNKEKEQKEEKPMTLEELSKKKF